MACLVKPIKIHFKLVPKHAIGAKLALMTPGGGSEGRRHVSGWHVRPSPDALILAGLVKLGGVHTQLVTKHAIGALTLALMTPGGGSKGRIHVSGWRVRPTKDASLVA
jgi:hypothetical protein